MSNNTACYNNAEAVSGDIPCGFSTGFTNSCCGAGWDCLTNGLCREHGTTAYSQGTCTDPTFQNCLSFCNSAQFGGYTEVSRCEPDGNSWCCAGAAGQGQGGVDCCTTDLTTALEPYPVSAAGIPAVASTPVSFTTTVTSSPSSTSSMFSSTRSSSVSPIASSAPTASQTSALVPTSTSTSTGSASPQPTSANQPSVTGIEVGVPMALVIILLACLAFFIWRKNRKPKQPLVDLDRPEMQRTEAHELGEHEENLLRELDITHYELPPREQLRHELGSGL